MFASFNVGSASRAPYMNGEQGFVFVQERECISVNTAACFTSCTFSVLTIGTALLATAAVSEVAMFALALVAVVFAAASMASISAWVRQGSAANLGTYYRDVKDDFGFFMVGILQVGVQTVVKAVCEGMGQRVTDRVSGRGGFNIN